MEKNVRNGGGGINVPETLSLFLQLSMPPPSSLLPGNRARESRRKEKIPPPSPFFSPFPYMCQILVSGASLLTIREPSNFQTFFPTTEQETETCGIGERKSCQKGQKEFHLPPPPCSCCSFGSVAPPSLSSSFRAFASVRFPTF